MTARALMFMGTGSDVGKSLIVAGLCRLFSDRGIRVAPFKPQNMSNNAAVTDDGGEIGRAQALQARAARVASSVHMNPVLLKPQSDVGAQVVVRGRMQGNASAKAFQALKPTLMPDVLDSFGRLKADYDLILIEGAGSASEINLRANDIANMGFARAANVPIILIGDIDRGGVIASIVGTKSVIDGDDAALIGGFIVNKMRGDASLFADGMDAIARLTGWASLGLVPFHAAADLLPAEDALALQKMQQVGVSSDARHKIVVPMLPRISNFDDLDPLRQEPTVVVEFMRRGDVLPADTRLVLLPGSKSTIDDLLALRAQGWDIDIAAHVRRGGYVLGLCGGYQMLGTKVSDPHAVEGPARSIDGLGHLHVETVFSRTKTLAHVTGKLAQSDMPFTGYEMHIGETTGADTATPFVRLSDGRAGGAVSPSGRVAGCYVHGLFASDAARSALLEWIGAEKTLADYERSVETALDSIAAHLAKHIDIEALLKTAR